MRITVRQLKQLIKEEVKRTIMLRENAEGAEAAPSPEEIKNAISKISSPEQAMSILKKAGIDLQQVLRTPEAKEIVSDMKDTAASRSGEGVDEAIEFHPDDDISATG